MLRAVRQEIISELVDEGIQKLRKVRRTAIKDGKVPTETIQEFKEVIESLRHNCEMLVDDEDFVK
jgi:hypothetical protein